MSDSVRPHRWQPTRLLCPWDSPGKNTGVGCHFLLQCVKVKSFSRIRLLAPPWTSAYQAPLSMGFSRQEYWSGLPLPSPSFFLFFNLTILYWFCHTSTRIHHRCTGVPHPEPPPSSRPIPSLWVIPVHQPQASSIVHRTWTGNSFHI